MIMMLSITEMRDKTKEAGHLEEVEKMLDRGYYDHDEMSILGTGIEQREPSKLSNTDRAAIIETLRKVPLKEFLAKSGTTGIAGAAYLIPDKIYQVLFDAAAEKDKCADIAAIMLGPDQVPGSSVKIDYEVDGQLKVKPFSSGGKMPQEEIQTGQVTLTPVSYGINFNIGNDLIEDNQFDLVEYHLRRSGEEIGEYAMNLASTVLGTATDGDGTVGSSATGNAGATFFTGGTTFDIVRAAATIEMNQWTATDVLTTTVAARHNIVGTGGIAGNDGAGFVTQYLMNGLPKQMGGFNLIYSNVSYLLNTTGAQCITVVFDKSKALAVARKRWLRIEKYADPVQDLVGGVVTFRQQSKTIMNDAVYRLTET